MVGLRCFLLVRLLSFGNIITVNSPIKLYDLLSKKSRIKVGVACTQRLPPSVYVQVAYIGNGEGESEMY